MSICDRLRDGVACPDVRSFHELAAAFARELPPDRALALHGPLGSGKTTFVQGLAQAWHCTTPVTSPTFTLCVIHRGARTLVHIDAYRLDRAVDADALHVDEFLVSPWCLCVEWPERAPALAGPDALHLEFGIASPGVHTVRLSGLLD